MLHKYLLCFASLLLSATALKPNKLVPKPPLILQDGTPDQQRDRVREKIDRELALRMGQAMRNREPLPTLPPLPRNYGLRKTTSSTYLQSSQTNIFPALGTPFPFFPNILRAKGGSLGIGTVNATKEKTYLLMQQTLYSTQERVKAMDPIINKYKLSVRFRMGLAFSKIEHMLKEMHILWTYPAVVHRHSNFGSWGYHLLYYQHALRKYLDFVLIIDEVSVSYEKYLIAQRDLQHQMKPKNLYTG